MPVTFQRTITLPDPEVWTLKDRHDWSHARCPHPGVYVLYVGEECVYVGKSINSMSARVHSHLWTTMTWGMADPQKEMHDTVRTAAEAGTLTVHCFRCAAPDQVEGDVVACLQPTFQGKARWHRVSHGGATVEAKCIRVE